MDPLWIMCSLFFLNKETMPFKCAYGAGIVV